MRSNTLSFYCWYLTDQIPFISLSPQVKAGDVIGFPTGEKGAHVIKNDSENEKLVYIDFGTKNSPDVVHLPDINKIMVISKEVNGIYDK